MPRKNSYPCAIDGCAGTRHCKGFCQKHYLRFMRHGDPLVETVKGTHRESNRVDGRRGKASAEYTAWQAMKRRCYSPGQHAFHRYGGRGIRVDERWLSGADGRSGFECFLSDMGRKPTPMHSLDRINTDGNYEPGNCRWATISEQARNRSNSRIVIYKGRSGSLAEHCEKAGANYDLVHNRLNRDGWSLEEAIETPSGGRRDHNPDRKEKGQ